MSVDGEFKRLMADDRLCTDVLKAVRENDTAALRRLGFGGFAQYAGRLSELMTVSVRGELDFGMNEAHGMSEAHADDFGELMRQVNSPARYAHHLVNECGTAIQTALDERQGLRLRVVQPPYNDGRTKSLIGDALTRETPEQGKEALATGLGTEVKDAGNEFMKQNAEQRSRAGFTVTVERSGGVDCCPWCADRVGRWELKNAPKDVFGCHDNCTCMVEYTNSRGVTSQRLGGAKFVDVEYEPTRLTDGAERGASEPKRLTGGANGGIINYRDSDYNFNPVSDKALNTDITIDAFADKRLNDIISREMHNILQTAKKYIDGTEIGVTISVNDYTVSAQVKGADGDGAVVIPERDSKYVSIHNHASYDTLSTDDLSNFLKHANEVGAFVIGNNGDVYGIIKSNDYDWMEYQLATINKSPDQMLAEIQNGESVKYGLSYYKKLFG